ncbi:MAG: group 1 truncated hemoglobin [Planctomycetes bacterium]|nr:group 1 truncated hemoglobin [Planctomycetota bacterium]
MTESNPSLYVRLGGYDAISAVAANLLPRLIADEQLGRFWRHRGTDGMERERQLLVDFLCSASGGPLYYRGRNMKLTHQGMGISEDDWQRFLAHVSATLAHFQLAPREAAEVFEFVGSLRHEIVE